MMTTIQTTMRTTTTELRRRESTRRGGERVRGISRRYMRGSHFRVKKIFHFIQRVILKYTIFYHNEGGIHMHLFNKMATMATIKHTEIESRSFIAEVR